MKVALLYQPRPAHLEALCAAGAEPMVAATIGDARAAVAAAEAILGNRFFAEAIDGIDQGALRWVQTPSVGVERHLALLAPHVALTNARGVFDDDVADHALALALGLLRGLGARRWERVALEPLAGSTAMVLGLGGIGRGIARRLAACGARVLGVRRSAGGVPPGVSEVLGPADWRSRLAEARLLMLALPLTPATRGCIGAGELSALPPGAALVNMARGELVDETALLAAIRSGLRAGLDVFAEEPLPAEHPFWTEALVTPHLARPPDAAAPRWEPLFEENLRRFAAGQPLINEVSRELGY